MYQNFIFLANDNTFNEFLKVNAIWLALGCVGLIICVVGLILLFHFKKKEKKAPLPTISKKDSLDLLGGEDNVISSKIDGRRVSVVLKDYDLVKKEELEKIGVDRFILMSDRLILVLKENSQDLYNKLFG